MKFKKTCRTYTHCKFWTWGDTWKNVKIDMGNTNYRSVVMKGIRKSDASRELR